MLARVSTQEYVNQKIIASAASQTLYSTMLLKERWEDPLGGRVRKKRKSDINDNHNDNDNSNSDDDNDSKLVIIIAIILQDENKNVNYRWFVFEDFHFEHDLFHVHDLCNYMCECIIQYSYIILFKN